MSQTEQTLEEVADSLTGFDEIAISQQFGRTFSDLAQHDATMFGRCLVFIVKRREGASDDEAKHAAMSMTVKEFASFFAETSAEEAGKEESPGLSLETSLTSVS